MPPRSSACRPRPRTSKAILAPGEYRFPLGTPAKDILQTLVKHHLDELEAQGVTDPAKQYEVVTVASIVQAEGGQAEYGDVAGAIYNRLKPDNTETNGLIQSDATVTYGLGTKSFHFDEAQKADKSNLYNTYANQGLPVGPIGSPGKTAIDAAAKPKTNELPLLGHHQPGHQGDQVLQDPGRAQRIRGAVQRLVRGQPGTLRMRLRAAVLGHPISHSKSPALHRAAYALLGLDIAYSAIDVTEDALPAFMRQVRDQARADSSWRGLSVTMPLKSAMVAEVDEVRGVARALGVVNTVAFESDGGPARLVAYNTDVAGIVNALRHAGAASSPTAAVLGGGGTAAAAVAALKELGAYSAELFVRDVSRAAEARAAAAAGGTPRPVLPLAGARPPSPPPTSSSPPCRPARQTHLPLKWQPNWQGHCRPPTPQERRPRRPATCAAPAYCWTWPTIRGPAG